MSVERNKIAPWQEKGRWYQFFIESDGTAHKLTTSDIEGAAISGSYLKLPAGFHAVEYVVDLNVDTESAATYNKGIRLYADGAQGVVLPGYASIDFAYVYVFAYVA